ncbi:dipeptide ABC transporter ATP-binding protein [Rhodococcoides kyotonense]|uniref:Peptide/nickel transport system ATP-binding protein n=1 Tax=Rhodococcoides kyotonense TaxID=398843 RepID=A0A239GCM9_9NOCA|nr:ABC transporter ATP-binding protein [Rhodococcus kyotonensis]SNS66548.1 peptide/nickel transport system ATP-binding protein [Rhodococcus kyotonensis]
MRRKQITVDPTAPLLQIEDLKVAYTGRRTKQAVRGLDLTVQPGEFVAVVGESGSGKSTTVHAALRLLPSSAQIESGRISLGGLDTTDWRDRSLAQLRGPFVGFVPQDPGTSLNPVKRVGVQVLEAIRLHRQAESTQARELVLEKLRLAGLKDVERVYEQYPHELSGGMKQRVLIAVALASDPKLLIADEPTSALDVTVQKVILDHLAHLRDTLGLGILLVTHDLGVAADRADRVVVMKDGAIVEHGATSDVLTAPTNEYTQRLFAAAPTFRTARLDPTRDAVAVDRRVAVLEIDHVTKTFSAGRGAAFTAVDDASLVVRAGTTHAIVGESGAGKSTLARIAVGLAAPDEGTVTFHGRDVDGVLSGLRHRALRPFRREIQLVYQNPFSSLDPKFSVEQIVAEPLIAFGSVKDKAARRDRVEQLLASVALDGSYLHRRAAELSGGQRQRVAIARALAADPRLLVLDEAVSALDVSVQAQILQLLVDLQAELGLAYLFITHDLSVVRLVADDVTVMRTGQVVEAGAVADVFASPSDPYTRSLLDAVPGSASVVVA